MSHLLEVEKDSPNYVSPLKKARSEQRQLFPPACAEVVSEGWWKFGSKSTHSQTTGVLPFGEVHPLTPNRMPF